MSSRKRIAGSALIKDQEEEDDGYGPDRSIDPTKFADPETLAKRKIAVPRGRRHLVNANGHSSPRPNGNPFDLSQPSTSAPIANGNISTQSTNQNQALYKALNENFLSAVTELSKSAKLTGPWDKYVNQYLEFSKSIANGTVGKSDMPPPLLSNNTLQTAQLVAASPAPAKPLFGAPTNPTNTPGGAPANPFAGLKTQFGSSSGTQQPISFGATFKAPETASKPANPFAGVTSSAFAGNKPDSTPVFGKPAADNSATPDSAAKPFNFGASSFKPPAAKPADAAPVAQNGTSEKAAIEIDDDSSDDDDIKIEGPQFTMSNVPKTKDSPFSFSAKASEPTSKSEGPSFTFTADPKSRNDSPFKFSSPIPAFGSVSTATPAADIKKASEETPEEKAKEVPATTSAPSSQDHTWKPSMGFKFMSGSDAQKSGSVGGTASPFSFKAPPTSNSSFNFSASKTSESTNPFAGSTSTKPTNSPFSFPTTTTSTTSSTNGAGSVFGSASKPSKVADKEENNDTANNDNEDNNAESSEPSVSLSEKGPGEEDETAVYEKRAKVFELSEGQYKLKGLGTLRVLVHNDSKKARVLVRAEGSGRPLMNTLLRSQLTYKDEGKGSVKILDFGSDGKPMTLLVRVKTGDDSKELAGLLEKHKC